MAKNHNEKPKRREKNRGGEREIGGEAERERER